MASGLFASAAGALGRGSFNVIVNAGTAYFSAPYITLKNYPRGNLAMIVAIDTAFRIAITHLLDALKISFLEKGMAGHLLFPCLTFLTQPLSVKVAQKFFNASPHWDFKQSRIEVFGFIALGWKANMMIKDVMSLTGLQKA
jgi:hypothetical protein